MGGVAFSPEEDAGARGSVSPFEIVLTAEERRAHLYTAPYALVVRAKIVLMAREERANAEIGARLDTSPQVVHRWRKRFWEQRLKGPGGRSQKRTAPGVFPPRSTPRSKRWPASCLTTTGVPRRVGAARSWPGN